MDRLVLAFAFALGTLAAWPGPADGEPAKASDATAEPGDAAERSRVLAEAWVERLEMATTNLERTRAKLRADEAALTRARHRRYPRGEALRELEASVEKGRIELDAAEAELPVLLERARRAGVPPGLLLRFEPDA